MTNNVNNVSNPITVAQAGTGQSNFSSGAVLIGNGTGIINSTLGTNNQVLAGTSSSDPAFTSTATVFLNSITINSGTVLNKYSKGTFSPTLSSSGTPPTVGYNYQVGRYTRIGNRVFISSNLSASSISGGTGNAYTSALPFTINVSAGNSDTGTVIFQNTTLGAGRYYYLNNVPNSTSFSFTGCVTGLAFNALSVSAYTATTILSLSTIYEV